METKRAFVRYVSHEIRTPLNAACLGLSVLEEDIRQSFAESPSSTGSAALIEVVADITQACNIAVEILNDLLMYEKIEGGLLQLEKEEVEIGPFVAEVLKLFSMQVKERFAHGFTGKNLQITMFTAGKGIEY